MHCHILSVSFWHWSSITSFSMLFWHSTHVVTNADASGTDVMLFGCNWHVHHINVWVLSSKQLPSLKKIYPISCSENKSSCSGECWRWLPAEKWLWIFQGTVAIFYMGDGWICYLLVSNCLRIPCTIIKVSLFLLCMHYSAKCDLVIACHLSVLSLSVWDVGGSGPYKLKIVETNCENKPKTFAVHSPKVIHLFPGEHGEILGETTGGVGKSGMLEHKSSNISEMH